MICLCHSINNSDVWYPNEKNVNALNEKTKCGTLNEMEF
jgi:hypothetical protein